MTTLSYVDINGQARNTADVVIVDAQPPRPDLPIVVLLHGNSGTADDMSDPASHPGFNHDWRSPLPAAVDRGWHSYPNIGLWGFALDPLQDVQGWQPALTASGFSTVNYQQTEPTGALANAVLELRAVIDFIGPGRRIAVVAHSRGGLLIRRFLVDNAWDSTLMQRITAIVTLHSPHQGSALANAAGAVAGALSQIRSIEPARPLTDWIYDQVSSVSYQEFGIGSAFLAKLAQDESNAPATHIPFHTFGGSSSVLTRTMAWAFAPESVIPQVASLVPPRIAFHWTTFPIQGPTIAGDAPPLTPEISNGLGDVLVAESSTSLPFEASHHTRPLNHAEALWDPDLHTDVIQILQQSAVTSRALRITLVPTRMQVNSPAQFVVRAVDSVTGAMVAGDVIIDGVTVGVTNSALTATVVSSRTRVFDPDTRKWIVEIDRSSGEVHATGYPPTPIPFVF